MKALCSTEDRIGTLVLRFFFFINNEKEGDSNLHIVGTWYIR